MFGNFGFNPIHRTGSVPGGPTPPANQPPVNQPPAFTGGHGVDSFHFSGQSHGPVLDTHSIVRNVSNLPVNRESIVGGGHLSAGTFEALRNPNFEFPPIEG